MRDHPEYDRLALEYAPVFAEHLQAAGPPTVAGAIDYMKRRIYSKFETQMMEVITDDNAPEAPGTVGSSEPREDQGPVQRDDEAGG